MKAHVHQIRHNCEQWLVQTSYWRLHFL
jgi:hypothetical protein